MKPVKIRYMGIFPMTRAGYLLTATLTWLFAAVLVGVAIAKGVFPPLTWPWAQEPLDPRPGFGPWLNNHIYWVLFLLVIFEGIDVWVTLRKFAQKEAEQRARLLDNSPDLPE